MTKSSRKSSGFSLIEMIMVIVITGIIAGMVAVFIRAPVEGYVDSVRRAELTDAADVALRRITRDVRLALPNSLREVVSGGNVVGFEFIMTRSGGRYRDESDGSTCGNFLFTADINCPASTSETTSEDDFDVVHVSGAFPEIYGGDRIVVYNLGPGYSPTDAYSVGGGNVGVVDGSVQITANPVPLSTNPFPTQTPRLTSPSSRFQVVGAADLVVRYTCPGGAAMTRSSGCSFSDTSSCTSPDRTLVGSAATPVNCRISYAPAAQGRNGLLFVNLTLRDAASGESVTLFSQIHVDNTP